jgi:RNA polymerase sigma-70 factor (ECF subfamily)
VSAAIPITYAGSPRLANGVPEVYQDTLDLEALIDRHQAGLWRYLRALGADAALADDVVQESFLSVWNTPPSIPYSNAAAWMGWLRTVARNRFITVKRRERKQVNLGELDAIDELYFALSPDGSDTWLVALELCLASPHIDGRSRQILELRFRDGMTAREIGKQLNIGESNVGVTAHRAMAKLRACIVRRLNNE